MNNDEYRLIGEVHIPSDKREAFKADVLTLLARCGIRNSCDVRVHDISFSATIPAIPDENGKIYFNYCTLEQEVHKNSFFDLNTCTLEVPDEGHVEFAMATTLLLFLCQAYSDTPCYLVCNGMPLKYSIFHGLLNYILGREVSCQNGNDVWNLFAFFHYHDECKSITSLDGWFNFITGPKNCTLNQLFTGLTLSLDEPLDFSNVKPSKGVREELAEENWGQRQELLFRLLKAHKDESDFLSRLKDLLSKDRTGRQKIAASGGDFALLAELSFYFYAPIFVKYYCLIQGEEFWSTWDKLEIEPYYDVIEDFFDDNSGYSKIPFYKAIEREDEDEFLACLQGDNLHLSEKLSDEIKGWQEDYQHLTPLADFNMEEFLANVLQDMYFIWHCPFVSKEVIDEFLAHAEDVSYQKLLMVLRKFIDRGLEMFPELPRCQAVKLVKKARDEKEITHIHSFMSLMENKFQRQRLFGI